MNIIKKKLLILQYDDWCLWGDWEWKVGGE